MSTTGIESSIQMSLVLILLQVENLICVTYTMSFDVVFLPPPVLLQYMPYIYTYYVCICVYIFTVKIGVCLLLG